jgi:hypothetical protein
MSKVAVGAALTIPAPAMVIALLQTCSESAANVFFYVLLIYLIAWSMAFVTVVHAIVESRGNRSRGKLPPRRTPRGQALEGEQETGTGDDLMFSDARRGIHASRLPGRAATQRSWQSSRCGEGQLLTLRSVQQC